LDISTEKKIGSSRNFWKFHTYGNKRIKFNNNQNTKWQWKRIYSKKFIDICNKAGIQRNLIVPRNPQSNGRAERLNGTIINATKALLNQAKLSYHFWEDAVRTAVKIYNMTPRTAIKFKIPDELYYHKEVNIDNLRVIGCKAYYYIDASLKNSKFDNNTLYGIFLGYDEYSPGYVIFGTNDCKTHCSWCRIRRRYPRNFNFNNKTNNKENYTPEELNTKEDKDEDLENELNENNSNVHHQSNNNQNVLLIQQNFNNNTSNFNSNYTSEDSHENPQNNDNNNSSNNNVINSTVELIKNKFKISKCSSVNHILGITMVTIKLVYIPPKISLLEKDWDTYV